MSGPTHARARLGSFRGSRGVWVVAGALLLGACARPPAASEPPRGPTRLPILDPDYGRAPELPEAVKIGDPLDALSLALADGGSFELAPALAAGPVILIWVGGAESASLSAWVEAIDDEALAQFDPRSATLVWVRSLPVESALAWAVALGLQTPVAADLDGQLAASLDLDGSTLEHAVVIVDHGAVVYRKLGGRRPELAELLAVLDGEAERWRCCPDDDACAPACERVP